MSHRIVTAALVAALGAGVMSGRAVAQAAVAASGQNIDASVSYVSMRSLKAASTENFWMQGGSVALGMPVWRNLSVAGNLTGTHASSIGSSGVPLSLITVTAGPRYRWQAKPKWSLYGEALFGVADGFNSVFPGSYGRATDSRATSFAMQLGGGADVRLRHGFFVRALDVGYVRTQLPNGTDGVQNSLRIGAGVGLILGHGR